ncbi:biotin--[acetyl-CoA-carboxylase] ligase [Acetobacteraceae bacterium KSS8]|uniref:Biotin--[acetyl-CoA-carboxylase] ligase n=1 Tax=Endosaccharibacter trunci TaxID=2812733 RepID=A0ABT1W6F5_9PROT|nr:biotin--[acetyl-CoA-carboxylase] ligase [Acetobacteraceae bacterium KSS8]
MTPAARPDRPHRLLGRWRFETYETLGSTNDHCIALAEAGEKEGLAVMARRQTGARGSRGRSWSEPPAGNLALSVLLRPAAMQEPGLWPFVAGLALHDGLEQVSGAALLLKWPNDVLLGDRKLAGILIERGVGPDGHWMVIGFGANLAAAPVLADRIAACLADAGPPPAQEEAAEAVLAALDRWCAVFERDGFAPIREAWLTRAHPIGARLRAALPAASGRDALANRPPVEQREGSFGGIAADGALLLEWSGRLWRIETGEVLLLGDGR